MTYYEYIKNMSLYDMAAWMKMLCVTLSPDDVDEDFIKWLESEYKI